MLLDSALLFSDNQAVTVTALGTNALDMGAAGMGQGNPLTLFANVGTAFVGGTSIVVSLQECDTVGGTYTDVIASKAILTADLTAGKAINLGIVPVGTEQFLKMKYTVSGTMTAGTINSGIKLGTPSDDAATVISQ